MMRFLRQLTASLRPDVHLHVTYHVNVDCVDGGATVGQVDKALALHDDELLRLLRESVS